MRDAVLFVGWRRDAVKAARDLDLDVLLLEPSAAGALERPGVLRRGRVDFAAAEDRVGDVAEQVVDGRNVVAVAALTEGSVVAAAHVRARLGVPGHGIDVARRCHDKLEMKQAIAAAGIPCAPTRQILASTTAEDLVAELGLPVVIKQRASSGGRGTVVARDARAVAAALHAGWLAEGFVDGVEMSVESFVQDGEVVFTNLTEYFEPGVANILPAALDEETRAAILDLNRRSLTAIGVRTGITHLELFRTRTGPWFGEVASRPPGGWIMRLMKCAYEFDPWGALIRLQRGERPAWPSGPRRAAGVWVLHPGPGQVRAVRGLEAVRAQPGVRRAACQIDAGDRVHPRRGTGESVGHIEVEGADRDEVARRLIAARESLVIEMERVPGT